MIGLQARVPLICCHWVMVSCGPLVASPFIRWAHGLDLSHLGLKGSSSGISSWVVSSATFIILFSVQTSWAHVTHCLHIVDGLTLSGSHCASCSSSKSAPLMRFLCGIFFGEFWTHLVGLLSLAPLLVLFKSWAHMIPSHGLVVRFI